MVAILKERRILRIKPRNKEREKDMTDTRYFKTIATNRSTGVSKVFYGLFVRTHNNAAKDWLASL